MNRSKFQYASFNENKTRLQLIDYQFRGMSTELAVVVEVVRAEDPTSSLVLVSRTAHNYMRVVA